MKQINRIPRARDRRSAAGYSLTEVLVAVAIFAVIIIAALVLYDRSNREFKAGVEASNMQQNTRVAFTKLEGDLRMTGYDFDRDGIPISSTSGTNTYQQPDEQFEYIGPSAITIRGNFDYELENSPCTVSLTDNCDNGREKSLESAYLPLVTTANDEIVAYGLVPDSQGTTIPSCNPATNCIQFYADTHNPRAAFPDAAHGGLDESVVQIAGVDLCTSGCNSPPYTLYRFSLKRDETVFTTASSINRTPLATNIRSMNFTYYQDANGKDPLKDIDNVVNVSSGEAVRGNGQWTVANPLALVGERSIRSKINSVRVTLVGMNESADPSYTDPAEGLTSMQHYRKYQLETLAVPRNIQKRGMREQDILPPGPPTNVVAYTGRCGILYMTWTAPAVSAVRGAPDQYKIIYGPVSSPQTYPSETTTFTNTFGYVTGLSPATNYAIKVVALNSYGSNSSATAITAIPKNSTKPSAPTGLTATTNLENKVKLTWARPTTNASGAPTGGPTVMLATEIYGYRIERTTDVSGSAGWATVVDYTTFHSTADTVTYEDTTVVNCTPYLYRVTAVEFCYGDNSYNNPASNLLGISATSTTAQGQGASAIAPAAPADLIVDQSSPCAAGICAVNMSWPKVTADVNSQTINVSSYHVYRRLKPATTWTLVATESIIPASGNVTHIDYGVDINGGKQYEYMVRAVQCGIESADSGTRPFPCTFPAGVLSATVLSANSFDGGGTSTNPWLFAVDPVVTVGVADSTKVSKIVATVYTGTTVVNTFTKTAAPWTFTWVMPVDATQRIDVAVTETGGCVSQYTAYLRDEAQACCLETKSSDATVVSYTTGQKFVDVFLKNVCGETLTLSAIAVTFNSAITPGGTKFDKMEFPAASGVVTYTFANSAGTSVTGIAPPSGTTTVAAGSSTYKIRVYFTKALTNPTQPLTLFQPSYFRPADATATACPVVP